MRDDDTEDKADGSTSAIGHDRSPKNPRAASRAVNKAFGNTISNKDGVAKRLARDLKSDPRPGLQKTHGSSKGLSERNKRQRPAAEQEGEKRRLRPRNTQAIASTTSPEHDVMYENKKHLTPNRQLGKDKPQATGGSITFGPAGDN